MENIIGVQKKNLRSLLAEFHNRGKAARGLKTLRNHIKQGQLKELASLLDHHNNHGGYWGKELVQRFEIDALFECYNLLIVARAAGYIPADFGKKLNEEITTVLACKSVIPYYTEYYPYTMVSYVLRYALGKQMTTIKTGPGDTAIFNSFAALNRALKRDEDMERFMGMLDHVQYDDQGINDVIKILGNVSALSHALMVKEKTEAEMGVMGFIKYSAFMAQLRVLMEAAKHNPMLQSAMWMFHGYHLDRLNKKMDRVFAVALKNLQKGMTQPHVLKQMTAEIIGTHNKKQQKLSASTAKKNLEEAQALQAAIKNSLKQAQQDVAYIVNPKWGLPLKKYFDAK